MSRKGVIPTYLDEISRLWLVSSRSEAAFKRYGPISVRIFSKFSENFRNFGKFHEFSKISWLFENSENFQQKSWKIWILTKKSWKILEFLKIFLKNQEISVENPGGKSWSGQKFFFGASKFISKRCYFNVIRRVLSE